MRNYSVFFEQERDGGYSVSVPALPGCFSQGDTFEEALKNIQEAMHLYLAKENISKREMEQPVREFIVPVQMK